MKPPRQLLVLAAVMAVGGCATLVSERPPEQNAELRLDRGLFALEAGMYSEAFDDLAWVYSHCPSGEAGSRALVALAALELDPRNQMARPALGTELLARLLQTPDAPGWVRPLVETTYLTGLALGAPQPTDTTVAGDAQAGTPVHDHDEADEEYMDHAAVAPPEPDADPVYGCGAKVAVEDWSPSALPTLPGPSMARLLAEAEAKRESTAARADTLRSRLATVTEELEATRAELERIRKTLKP